MLIPKRVKYRKQNRGRMSGVETRGATVDFGEFGLQALEPQWITNPQIEAARIAISRHLKKGKIWIRIFPDKPFTKKPTETRQGKGKGPVDVYKRQALCIAELQVQLEEPMPGEFGKGKVSPEEWVERE